METGLFARIDLYFCFYFDLGFGCGFGYYNLVTRSLRDPDLCTTACHDLWVKKAFHVDISRASTSHLLDLWVVTQYYDAQLRHP